jgi:hypothetical protein
MVDYSRQINPLEIADYVNQRGDAGRARGEGMYLNRLMGEAYTAPDAAGRTSALQKLAKTHGQQAIAADTMFQQRDESMEARRNKTLVEASRMYVAAPETLRPQLIAQLRPQLEAFGLQLPDDPAQIAQAAQAIVQAYGGAAEGGVTVRSSFVGEDGNMYSIMSDGSVKAQGIGADRKLQAFDIPGVGPQVVDLRNATARTVTGQGGPQPTTTNAPPSYATREPDAVKGDVEALVRVFGGQITSGFRDPQKNAEVGGVPNSQHMRGTGFDAVFPSPQAKQAARAQARAMNYEAIDEGDHVHFELPPQAAPVAAVGGSPGMGGGGGPAPSGAPVAPPAQPGGPAWVRPVAAPAGSAPPSGYRARPDGSLEFITGGPADPANKPQVQDKPIPVGALRLQLETQEALSVAEGLDGQLAKYEGMIGDGSLDLGPVDNIASTARNALGVSSPNSRNYADFRAALEKMRNDSLRLNKGVQTEGDAQRAWNELTASINDPQVVKQRLATIRELNKRAIQLQQEKMRAIESNYRGKDAAPEDDINDLLQLYGDNI